MCTRPLTLRADRGRDNAGILNPLSVLTRISAVQRASPTGRVRAGVRRRFTPHQLRHARAVELAREGVPLIVIQRRLGHSNLGITSIYLQGIDNAEIIDTVHARTQPMVPVSTSLPRRRRGCPRHT